jgi:acetolactate synthase-1/2/3 large subunit
MKMTGAKVFVEMLKREGVEVIFGFPGGAVLNIYDALFDADIKHILVRHEQGAVHAADGYARASGKPGVVLVTSGPGATNTVTGIATAYMDSVPIVVFTGQVPTSLIGNDAFQEADIVGITRPCTKHNYLVKNVEDLPRIIKEAFYIATTGRPGPVLVDIPKDITAAEFDFEYPEKVEIRGYKPVLKGHPLQIKKAVDEILSSSRPVIYGGGGLIHSNASKLLIELAEMLNIPVTLTLMGLGAFPGDHPLFLGMLGMHGTFYANSAVDNCDLLIAIGARFDDRVTGKVSEFAKGARIIHVDIDPSSISKSIKVDIPIVGDACEVLSDLLKLLKEKYRGKLQSFRNKMKPWLKQIEMWKKNHPLTYKMDSNKIKPQYVVERIYELTKGKAIITTEVGQNQMWAAQFYKFSKPRTFLTSGGLGTMGYGFPAAIGAQIARPDAVVIDIAGDGSIQMNIQELATAVQYRLPVKVAILNNRFLGMVRQWQELFYGKRYSMSCVHCHPDFVQLAEAYGAVGLRAEKPSEVDSVIKTALKVKDRPVLMDFLVEREEGVYPMVPAGAPIREMLLV